MWAHRVPRAGPEPRRDTPERAVEQIELTLPRIHRPSERGAQPAADQQQRRLESRIVNVNGELIRLTDGTVVRVAPALALQADLREGRAVKIIYMVKDGQSVATSIEFLEDKPAGDRK